MKNLKSFSVGHTAKGAIWWQAWPFDGEPRKGTADTIGAALGQIGFVADSPAPDADNLRERYESACHRENQAFQRIGELQAINGEQARTIADLMAEVDQLRAIVARMEALLPDPDGSAPTPPAAEPQQRPAKGPSSPAKPRKAERA